MKGNIQEILREIKEIESTDKSTLTINKNMINEAIKTGHISFIRDNVTDSRKAATNSYYEICGTDIVLMGVGNDHFVIVSRHVNNIDIIEKLKDFSFRLQRTGARREHVMAYAPKCLQDQGYTQSVYLTRAIASIELYGDIRLLDANYDVHHKGDCWDNRQGMILYLNSKLHNHRDSHMTGYVISSMAALIATVARLNQNYKELHLVATAM